MEGRGEERRGEERRGEERRGEERRGEERRGEKVGVGEVMQSGTVCFQVVKVDLL